MSGVQRAGGQQFIDASQLEQAGGVQQAGQDASQVSQKPTRQQVAAMRSQLYGPGDKAQISGQYAQVDGRGNRVGKEKTITKGETFPPTSRSGLSYKLVDTTKHTPALGVGGQTTKVPGKECERSGQYQLVDSSGNLLDRATTVTKGEPFPPTPKAGQKWRLVDASSTSRPGEKAEISGQYAVIGANGKPSGDEVTVVKGEAFPPTPRNGQAYRLVDITKHVYPEKARGSSRPGEIVKTSGQYELIAADGKKTGKQVTAVRGEPFPPTPKPGQSYRLQDKT